MDDSQSDARPGRLAALRQRASLIAGATDWQMLVILAAGVILALLVRLPLLQFKSDDFFASLKPWFNTIRSQGFSAFASDFSTYNPPYLYLVYLVLRLSPNVQPVIGVKIPGLFGDFACAGLVYGLVRLRYPRGWAPSLAACVALFAPTMIVNSALWGQADSLYTAGILGCLYFLLRRKGGLAMLAYGIALAFKLQALFLAPVLFALLLRGVIKWRQVVWVPAVLLLALVPAWIAGRPILSLLDIYLYQSSQFEFITMNAPSIYTWLPQTKQVFNLFYGPGVIAGAIAAFFLAALIYEAPAKLENGSLVELALLAMMVVPFFLPKMHERYFFPADVLSIVFAFYFPRYFLVAMGMNAVSFLAYEPFLFYTEPVPLPLLALGLLALISVVFSHAVRGLFAERAQAASTA